MNYDDVYVELVTTLSDIGVRPDLPIACEDYFARMADDFAGDESDFINYVSENMRSWFRNLSVEPEWLQEPEWQFHNGKPMIFVGQITVPHTGEFFTDTAAFFTFWDLDLGETKVIVQVA
ncbi:MAG: hypothetical protein COA78_25365 [Blastopirellula sp.]|nr:MAG: hypothetical protein COA78_25365 [Blastopirellula sp.]